MKQILFLVFLVLASILSAQTISNTEALDLAQRFMSDKSAKSIVLIPVSVSEKGYSHFYVFTDELNSSFVVMSATRNAFPVIAWSFESGFVDPMPDVVKGYFDWAEVQLADAVNSSRQPAAEVEREWISLEQTGKLPVNEKSNISPLLTTTWDQGCYYNGMSPIAPSGPCGRCYAGCVATAMGQVMKYHNYPAVGQGTHTYGTFSYPNQTADFGATTYVWDSMPNSINDDNEYIAEFLYHCGVSVDMDFAFDGSGAQTTDARDAFVDYFKYSDYCFHLEKTGIMDQSWYDLIENELQSKRPIMYRGFGSGGHAFVLDGMQNSDHFHFNWGWSGYYNGYFILSNLSPGGSDFTADQAGIFGVEPAETDMVYCQSQTVLTAVSDTISDGSGEERYGNNSTCKWLIQPPGAGLIYIHFLELETEKDIDPVYVFNGTSTSDPMVAMVSGFTVPSEILVWGPSALVFFQTDQMMRAGGFTLTYTSSQVGLNEAWNHNLISVFPNPADEKLSIGIDDRLNSLVKKIEILTSEGQVLDDIDNPGEMQSIRVADYPAGVYFLRFVGENDIIVKPFTVL